MKVDFKKIFNYTRSYNFKVLSIYSGIIICIFLIIGMTVSYMVGAQKNNTEEATLTDEKISITDLFNNAEEIEITLNNNQVNPSQLSLKPRQLYILNITKSDNSSCEKLTLVEYEKDYPLVNRKTALNLQLNKSGNYTLECNTGNPAIYLEVK